MCFVKQHMLHLVLLDAGDDARLAAGVRHLRHFIV